MGIKASKLLKDWLLCLIGYLIIFTAHAWLGGYKFLSLDMWLYVIITGIGGTLLMLCGKSINQ